MLALLRIKSPLCSIWWLRWAGRWAVARCFIPTDLVLGLCRSYAMLPLASLVSSSPITNMPSNSTRMPPLRHLAGHWPSPCTYLHIHTWRTKVLRLMTKMTCPWAMSTTTISFRDVLEYCSSHPWTITTHRTIAFSLSAVREKTLTGYPSWVKPH